MLPKKITKGLIGILSLDPQPKKASLRSMILHKYLKQERSKNTLTDGRTLQAKGMAYAKALKD